MNTKYYVTYYEDLGWVYDKFPVIVMGTRPNGETTLVASEYNEKGELLFVETIDVKLDEHNILFDSLEDLKKAYPTSKDWEDVKE